MAPSDLRAVFTVYKFCCAGFQYERIQFVFSARARLLKHLALGREGGSTAIRWLERKLMGAYDEERGYAMRCTHAQLVTALRTLARLHPETPPPFLPPAFLDAVKSNERIPERNQYLHADLEPLPYDDNLEPMVPWNALDTPELSRRADALYLAVRRRPPDNWELLARQAHWEPLRQSTIKICAELWAVELKRHASARKALLAFALELLALVDPTFPRSPDEALVESMRAPGCKLIGREQRAPEVGRASHLLPQLP